MRSRFRQKENPDSGRNQGRFPENYQVKHMVSWYYRSIFDELEELQTYLESLNREVHRTRPVGLLPSAGESAVRMLPAPGTVRSVEVYEHEEEVVVITVMAGGITKNGITLNLISPRALEISSEQKEEREEVTEGHYLHERRIGLVTQVVTLPQPVMDEGSSATFRNGVLEVHLKKRIHTTGRTIIIS